MLTDVLFAAISRCFHDVLVRKCWQLEGLPGCAQQLNRCISYRNSRWFPASYIYVLLGSIKYSRSRPHNRSQSDNRTWIWMLPNLASKKLKGRVVTCKTSKYQRRTSLMIIVGKKPNPTNMMLCEILFLSSHVQSEWPLLAQRWQHFSREKLLRGDEIWQLHRLICS